MDITYKSIQENIKFVNCLHDIACPSILYRSQKKIPTISHFLSHFLEPDGVLTTGIKYLLQINPN